MKAGTWQTGTSRFHRNTRSSDNRLACYETKTDVPRKVMCRDTLPFICVERYYVAASLLDACFWGLRAGSAAT
jgi:hypothetical protein